MTVKRALYRATTAAVAVGAITLACSTRPWPGATLPQAVAVRAPSAHYVEVTLEQAAGLGAVVRVDDYAIASPEGSPLEIQAADFEPGRTRVILTTDTQSDVVYALVQQAAGADAAILDFGGSTAIEPAVLRAVALGGNSVVLQFSEIMDRNTTQETSCYHISGPAESGGVQVDSATLQPDDATVFLTTTALQPATYSVRVSIARGASGHLIDPTRCTALFHGNVVGLPRVVGAASIANNRVVVTYNQPMGRGAEDPASYTIVQENVHPEAGTLTVLDAAFLGHDRTVVELTTLPQSEVLYRVTVTNVSDVLGQPLGPASALVNPSSTTFAGTPAAGPVPDSDGDGLSDSEEQSGWAVVVLMAGGEVTRREVTSDPLIGDTDGDGLDDAQEKRRLSNPRDPDSDDDLLGDLLEVTRLFSSPTNQDTDGDGIADFSEVDVHKTSPILADTDGDGFDDVREVYELNRNPRVADLPRLDIAIGDMALRIDERFVDQTTRAVVSESSSTTTLSRSENTQFSESDTNTTSWFIEGGLEIGLSSTWSATPSTTLSGRLSARGGYSQGTVHQTTTQSAQAAQQVFQNSLSKAEQFAATVTREVVGAAIDSSLILQNDGDVAFTVSHLEVSALLPSRTRDEFVPVATLLPASELIGGGEAQFNLGPMEGKGPIIVSNQEIFPNLVEDLMRNPRGLIFEVANLDIIDEFGRNIAFQQQEVLGRSVILTIDPGDGTYERFAVAVNGAFGGRCDEASSRGGEICQDDSDCPGGSCLATFFGGFDADGSALAVPLDFVLQDVLYLAKNPREPDALVAGPNGRVDTVAVGDDIQVVPIGTTGLNDRSIVVRAGEDGILDTLEQQEVNNAAGADGDDEPAMTTGYETSRTCNADTAATINEPDLGGDGLVSTRACEDSPLPPCQTASPGDDCCDDVQEVAVGATVSTGAALIGAGDNGILESTARGDDEYHGPGRPCARNSDCTRGVCEGREVLVRFGNSKTGDPNRFWVVLSSEDTCNAPPAECAAGIPAGSDFGEIPLRPTQAVTLAFGQDIDRDGLFAREEFIYGSSDASRDTDGDTLGDFAEIRVGWEVDVIGRFPEAVFPDARFEDSDFDGLDDPQEQDCLTDPSKRDTDGDGLPDAVELGVVSDPDGDGHTELGFDLDGNERIDDFERSLGRCCASAAGPCASEPVQPCRSAEDCAAGGTCTAYPDMSSACPPPSGILTWPARLDPRNPDTDGDSVPDGRELELHLNPLDPTDAEAFRDSDRDGLKDVEERAGWQVEITLCGNTCAQAFDGVCQEPGRCSTDAHNEGEHCAAHLACPGGMCAGLNLSPTCDFGSDCGDCGSATERWQAFPDPLRGDSDFDGLPDRLERDLASDPQDDDTDRDGLPDFDEFDDFNAYVTLNFEFEGFVLVEGDSRMLGTSPTSQDGDGDRLADSFELMQGWRVLLPGENVREVFSNPRYPDSDLDALDDLEEYLGADAVPEGRLPDDSGDASDPLAPDTDHDGRLDGEDITRCEDGRLCARDCDCCSAEAACCTAEGGCCGDLCLGSNPLLADVTVRVNLVAIDNLCGPVDGPGSGCADGDCNAWRLAFTVERPLQDQRDTLLDALRLHRLLNQPADGTQWDIVPLGCAPACDPTLPASVFPAGHPQREYCAINSTNISCGSASGNANENVEDYAPIFLDGIATTFSLPLGDPFVVEVHVQEADSCTAQGYPQSSCDIFDAREFDSAELLSRPYRLVGEGELLSDGPCEVEVVYEVQVAPFAWGADPIEANCNNLLDDDQDGRTDCADTDCDLIGLCEGGGGAGWVFNPATGSSYRLSAFGTWAQAEAEAVVYGGHLVTINDHAENDWLKDMWSDPTLWIGLHQNFNVDGGRWYCDYFAGGRRCWEWVSGAPLQYANWDPDEPNNAGDYEDVAVMVLDVPGWVRGQWNDRRGSSHVRGIIEVPGDYRKDCSDYTLPACTQQADCPSGVCIEGACDIPCIADADCPEAWSCRDDDWLPCAAEAACLCLIPLDNDSDGLANCADLGCRYAEACNPEVVCDDGQDNDADGLIDCGDPDCDDFPDCEVGDRCAEHCGSAADCAAGSCLNDAGELCQPGEDCGCDDDEDGLANCADPGCHDSAFCMGAVCGDGELGTGEDCDDGNTTPGDGCDQDCRVEAPPACGDGVVNQAWESCDGTDLLTTCHQACRAAGTRSECTCCGDAVVDDGEQCDDGNGEPGDGCDASCQSE